MPGYLQPDPNNGPPNVYYPPQEINQNDPREAWVGAQQTLQPIAQNNPQAADNVYQQAVKPALEARTGVMFPATMFMKDSKSGSGQPTTDANGNVFTPASSTQIANLQKQYQQAQSFSNSVDTLASQINYNYYSNFVRARNGMVGAVASDLPPTWSNAFMPHVWLKDVQDQQSQDSRVFNTYMQWKQMYFPTAKTKEVLDYTQDKLIAGRDPEAAEGAMLALQQQAAVNEELIRSSLQTGYPISGPAAALAQIKADTLGKDLHKFVSQALSAPENQGKNFSASDAINAWKILKANGKR